MDLIPEYQSQATRLRPRLKSPAERGIYFGTSSWKYDGWLGRPIFSALPVPQTQAAPHSKDQPEKCPPQTHMELHTPRLYPRDLSPRRMAQRVDRHVADLGSEPT
jgi:hypothetical protein